MNEIRALTGIRGVASLWVFVHHFYKAIINLFPTIEIFGPLIKYGSVGVDLFFILSGFIITYVYSGQQGWSRRDIYNYSLKRFARVYPVHLVTLLVFLGLVTAASFVGKEIGANGGDHSAKQFWLNVFMLQGFPFAHQPSWNYPSWSISAEFFGYFIIFPLCIYLSKFSLFRNNGFIISILIILIYLTLQNYGAFGRWDRIGRISFEFLAGSALFYGHKKTPQFSYALSKLLVPITIIGFISCYLTDTILTKAQVQSILVVFSLLYIVGLSTDKGIICRFLGMSKIRYLGLISYSLYMTHAIPQKIFFATIPTSSFSETSFLIRLGVLGCYIVLPLMLAVIFYHFCEEFSRKFLLKKLAHK